MSYFRVNFWWLQTDSTNVIFVFLNFFIYVGISEGVLHTQQSNLCSNQSISCAHQLSLNSSEDACILKKYIQNSTECSSQIFKARHVSDAQYGDVLLSAYVYKHEGYQFPAFNISFSDIKWSKARFRFYESGQAHPDVCREFEVTNAVSINTTLFFDCLWRNDPIEGHTYFFQLLQLAPDFDLPPLATTYKFRVPTTLSFGADVPLSKLNLFVSVDMSTLPVLKLIVQTAPVHFNITRYRVRLLRTWVDQKWAVLTRDLLTAPDQTHIYEIYDTAYRPGIYNFTVQPINDACPKAGCLETVTPEILIVATTDTHLLIVMVGTVILIPVLLAAYFMWRRTCVDTTAGNDAWRPPRVLLVYNPDYTSHLSNMIRFTEYLKKCHINPMLDIFCIPTSDSKNPTVWYREAFRQADSILVFASPAGPNSKEPHPANPYLKLGEIALDLLDLELISTKNSAKRIAFCILPGCIEKSLPFREEQARLQTFKLPASFPSLLKFIGVSVPKNASSDLQEALNDKGDIKSDIMNRISSVNFEGIGTASVASTAPLIPVPASPNDLAELYLGDENQTGYTFTGNNHMPIHSPTSNSSGIDDNSYNIDDMRL